MCFNGYMSGGFAALGLFVSWWINNKTSNFQLALGVFFFFTMEFLQAVQYAYIASELGSPTCDTLVNKILTIAGFIHICLQPYFCHLINEALSGVPSKSFTEEHNAKLAKYRSQYVVIKRLCLMGGFLLFLRFPMSYIPGWNTLGEVKSTEWLRGQEVCTFKAQSMVHLGWSVPMADPTYNIMGAGIHSFLMFAPFFALYEKKGMVIQGLVLYLTGPFMASVISPNLMEQASIWCFFSIAQIAIMLFLIRETLVRHWGRGRSITESIVSVSSTKRASTPTKSRKSTK